MGNEKSKPHAAAQLSSERGDLRPPSSPRTRRAFRSLTNDDCDEIANASFERFQEIFGNELAECLWTYLSEGAAHSAPMSINVFDRHFRSLTGNSTDIYAKVVTPAGRLLRLAASAAGADPTPGDAPFVAKLLHKMTNDSDDPSVVVSWKHSECPRLLNALQGLVTQKLLGYGPPAGDYSSDLLSPFQMWYVQCCLPSRYFPSDSDKKESQAWTPLYTSAQHGISVSRFEANVFDYRGPTVTILSLSGGQLVVLAVDQEWRHSGTPFGGADSMFYQLEPSLLSTDAIGAVYCNFKVRAHGLGLHVKKVLDLDKDMSNVNAIEVWGCSGSHTLAEQQKMKQWQSRQIEKYKKVRWYTSWNWGIEVPLPGNWDENPDKTLLEMAGFNFSTEKRDDRRQDS